MEKTIGVLFFTLGHIFAWFQFNSQFVWEWWKDRPFVAVLTYSIPMGLCFWTATKYIVTETNELWAARLMGYGVGIIIFSILSYTMMKESIFTTKTMLCLILSCIIIGIQVFWK